MEWFISLLQASGDYGIVLLKYIIRTIIITFSSLGLVYLIGRLLNFKVSNSFKNKIAAIALFTASFTITYIYFPSKTSQMIWESIAFALVASVVYVTIGWKFYERMDSWLDKKGLKDRGRK
jgi:hypothetical protein